MERYCYQICEKYFFFCCRCSNPLHLSLGKPANLTSCPHYLDDNHLFKKWDFYRKQHGLKSTLHELRHTLISVCKSDMPEELLKQIVGHTVNTDTFGIYGHRVEGEMERAASIFDDIFDKLLK